MKKKENMKYLKKINELFDDEIMKHYHGRDNFKMSDYNKAENYIESLYVFFPALRNFKHIEATVNKIGRVDTFGIMNNNYKTLLSIAYLDNKYYTAIIGGEIGAEKADTEVTREIRDFEELKLYIDIFLNTCNSIGLLPHEGFKFTMN